MKLNEQIIYFDNASTTRVYPCVLDIYRSIHEEYFANPSSIHKEGQKALYLFNKTKDNILSLLKMKDHQLIMTSGATEANNLAIKGIALRYKNRGNHLITSIYEHPSVLEAFKQLEDQFGFKVTYLSPADRGVITANSVKEAITDQTILVSVMAVNNEIGSINEIEKIASLLKGYPKIIFHVDACQAIGKLEKEISYNDVDLITVSAHKIHGLVGSGALIKRKRIELLPLNSGGGQEYNYRSGTEDLANLCAFYEALKLALEKEKENYQKVSSISKILINYLQDNKYKYELNSFNPINPYIINFSTLNKKGSVVVEALSNHNIMVSSVSACHSSKEKGSYVVKSLNKSDKVANNTIRVSLDASNTIEEMNIFISTIDKIIGEIR